MAGKKSKKVQDRALQRSRLTRERYFDFTTAVSALRADLDEASTEHAGAFKRGDSIGVHLDVSKLCMKLDKMEPTKRADWLRAFDTYRDWYEEWTMQGDMLDTIDETTTAPSQGYNAGADEEAEADAVEAAAAESEAAPQELADAPAPVVGAVDADFGDDKPLTLPEELVNAGQFFSDGQAAALEDKPVTDNPNDIKHPGFLIWERGHANGVRIAAARKEESAADTDPPVVDQDTVAPKGRRKPRASAEAASETVLH